MALSRENEHKRSADLVFYETSVLRSEDLRARPGEKKFTLIGLTLMIPPNTETFSILLLFTPSSIWLQRDWHRLVSFNSVRSVTY